jgi:hypothetical protein
LGVPSPQPAIEDFREDFKKEANDFFDFVLLNEKALPSPGTAER